MDAQRLPRGETPCFDIHRIELAAPTDGEALSRFAWLPGALDGPQGDDSPLHVCLGAQGVGMVLHRAQQQLLAKGFVTSRVAVLPQDLSQGTLVLTLVPGRVQAIRFNPPLPQRLLPQVSAHTVVPLRSGDILNLRAIEQALDNFKRVPSVDASINIEPAAGPQAQADHSDLVIGFQQSALARFTATLDDSGSKATGKLQGSATLSLDSPLGLSDLLNVTLGHDVGDGSNSEHGTRSTTLAYSLPLGYWAVAASTSASRYYQTVAGLSQNYTYSGANENSDVKLSRVVYRDALRKTTFSLKAWQRKSNNYIDDTEVQVQRRIVGGWELGASHRELMGDATIEGNLSYKFGTPDFGTLAAPEEAFDEGTSKFGLVLLDLSVNIPLQWAGQRLRYSGTLRVQDNTTPLIAQDRFAIGGRYTVRGFDGEASLSAERGWLLRNELGVSLGGSGQEVYLGLDCGEVTGRSSPTLLGSTLSGVVMGLRGAVKRLQYDLFIGAPVSKPTGFSTAAVTAGFSLNMGF